MDFGLVRTLSDGTFVEPRNSFKKQMVRLAGYQRSQARKQKFSENWKKDFMRLERTTWHENGLTERKTRTEYKGLTPIFIAAKARIRKLHEQIRNARRDFLHKVTMFISKSHAVVVVEDLKVARMSWSAKGTIERPGRNVEAKSRLNRLILDQGWSECRRRGRLVIAVPPMNTSVHAQVAGASRRGIGGRRGSLVVWPAGTKNMPTWLQPSIF